MTNIVGTIHKILKGKPYKWLNANLKKLMNERDQQLRKAKINQKESDWTSYKVHWNRHNAQIKKAKSNYHKSLITEHETNPRKFWHSVKSIYPNKAKSISTNTRFSTFFNSSVSTIKQSAFPLIDFTWSC